MNGTVLPSSSSCTTASTCTLRICKSWATREKSTGAAGAACGCGVSIAQRSWDGSGPVPPRRRPENRGGNCMSRPRAVRRNAHRPPFPARGRVWYNRGAADPAHPDTDSDMGIYDREYYRDENSSFLGTLVGRGRVVNTLIAVNVLVLLIQIGTR